MSYPATMHAVLLTGHGGLEKLDYRTDVPTPAPSSGEVLIHVAAARINNTYINTRIGWYSKTVGQGTNSGGATHEVRCDWADAELASIPCAYSTAENMLHRAGVKAERVLVTGASGGVGSAAVQLAKRRGAEVIALSSASKFADVIALGAYRVLERD